MRENQIQLLPQKKDYIGIDFKLFGQETNAREGRHVNGLQGLWTELGPQYYAFILFALFEERTEK
jgi:hypothetical protein